MKKIIACVLVAFNSVCCIVIETPQNALVFVGHSMSFKCRTTKGPIVREWLFNQSSESNSFIKIFANWNPLPVLNYNYRYNVDVDEFGSGVLYLNDTQLEDAGTYQCTVEIEGGQIDHFSAELIVLASDLICESSSHDDSLPIEAKKENKTIWCNVSYAGSLIPAVTWFRNGRNTTLPTESKIHVDKRKWFYFNTTFYVNSSDNEIIFSCEIHFEPMNSNKAIRNAKRASNVPGRKFTACVWKDLSKISTERDGPGVKIVVLSLGSCLLISVIVCAFMYVCLCKDMKLCGKDRNREDAEETDMASATAATTSNALESEALAAAASSSPTVPTDSDDKTLPAIELPNTEVYSNFVGQISLAKSI